MRQHTNYVIIMDSPVEDSNDKVIISAFFAPDDESAAKIARAYIRSAAAATKDHGVSAIIKDRCHLRKHEMFYGDK
jgi:hypothetical protein